MSMVTTPGEIIRVINQLSDVTQLIENYLLLWRKHCNGLNDVKIPDGKFLIQVTGFSMSKNNTEQVNLRLIHIRDDSYSYEVDEPCYDLGSGPWDGVDGVLGYSRTSHYETDYKLVTTNLTLPFSCFLAENIEQDLMHRAAVHKAEQEKLEKERKIALLEKEISKLKNQ